MLDGLALELGDVCLAAPTTVAVGLHRQTAPRVSHGHPLTPARTSVSTLEVFTSLDLRTPVGALMMSLVLNAGPAPPTLPVLTNPIIESCGTGLVRSMPCTESSYVALAVVESPYPICSQPPLSATFSPREF